MEKDSHARSAYDKMVTSDQAQFLFRLVENTSAGKVKQTEIT